MKFLFKIFIIWIVTNYGGYTFAQKQKGAIIEINLDKAIKSSPEEIMLSDIASDIRYIPLETTEECLIGDAYDIRYTGNDILVSSEGNFYHFDKNGKFLNRIGQKGNGPGEYNFGMFYFLDPVRKYMYIYELGYMLCYSFDGKFIRKLHAPDLNMGTAELFSKDYILYSNDTYFHNPSSPFQLFTMDTLGKSVGKIKGYIEKGKKYGLILSSRDYMYHYDGITYFKPALENMVYKVTTPKKMETVLKFETGSRNIDVSRNERHAKDRMKFISVFQIRETDKYIFMLYGYENKTYSGLYNKKTKTFRNAVIKDDLSGGMDIVPAGKCDSGYLMMVYFPQIIKEAKRYPQASLQDRRKMVDEIISNIENENNPILILITLRN
jgi:hypothetical protein